jgi:hypothetical protein
MKLLYDFPTIGEPHYACGIAAICIKTGKDFRPQRKSASLFVQKREGYTHSAAARMCMYI